MKNLKSIAIALLVVFGTTVSAQTTKKVDVSNSSITWVAKKVTGSHAGKVNLKEGVLIFAKGNKLTGGSFTVDMTSIVVTDLAAGKGKEKLEGHLTSDDFFGTEKYPEAMLVFKNIDKKGNVYKITSDLTIKGVTKSVMLDLTVTGNKATSKFKIDRTKYDIKYGSGSFFDNLGDKAINDEFEVAVTLVF